MWCKCGVNVWSMWCKCSVNVWSMWWHWGQGTQGTQGMYLLSTNPELVRQVSFLAQANWRMCQWPGNKQPKTQRKNCWKKVNASLGRQTDLAFCTAWTSKPNNAIVSTLILGKEQPKNVIFSLIYLRVSVISTLSSVFTTITFLSSSALETCSSELFSDYLLQFSIGHWISHTSDFS